MVNGNIIKTWTWALLAILRKDFLVSSKYPVSLFFSIFDTLISFITIILTARFIGLSSGTSPAAARTFESYILSGIVIYQFLDTVVNGFAYSLIVEKNIGTIERNFTAPLPRFIFLVGMTLYDLGLSFVKIGVLILGGKFLLGITFFGSHASCFLAFSMLFFMVLMSYGIGFWGAGAAVSSADPALSLFVLQKPLMVFCGVYYSIAVLPFLMRCVSLLFPITYAVDMFRFSISNHSTIILPQLELLVVVFGAILMPICGYIRFKQLEQKYLHEGKLGQF